MMLSNWGEHPANHVARINILSGTACANQIAQNRYVQQVRACNGLVDRDATCLERLDLHRQN